MYISILLCAHTLCICALSLICPLALPVQDGADPAENILANWNKEATVDNAFAGSKRQGVMNLLQHCDEGMFKLLIKHHSRMGSKDFVFSDECFSNKKLLPGHHFRVQGGGPKWAKRLQITKKSFNLFLQAMMTQQEQKSMRKKADKVKLEECATLAALVADIYTELQAVHAISYEKIYKVFIEPFIEGDINMHMELQGILATKDPNFSLSDIEVIRALISEFKGGSGSDGASASLAADVLVAAGELEQAEYMLFQNKCMHDIKLYKNYQSQMSCQKSAEYHEKLLYQVSRSQHAGTTISKVINDNGSNLSKFQWISLTDKAKSAELQQALTDFMDQICSV